MEYGDEGVSFLASDMSCYSSPRQLKSQWAKYRPPALPYNNNNQTQGGQPQYGQYQYGQSNSYANNPPPPSNFGRQYESQNGLPQQPPQTYQPSMAGQYGFGQRDGVGKTNGAAAATEDHEHGYEWAQAREQERIEREQAEAGGAAPPGYEVASASSPSQTGGRADRPDQTFAPPAGPPPGKQTSGTV